MVNSSKVRGSSTLRFPIATALIPRLKQDTEEQIADLMEEAAAARDQADELEVKIAAEAESLIDQFLSGDTSMVAKTHQVPSPKSK
jgi:hypothetical protein